MNRNRVRIVSALVVGILAGASAWAESPVARIPAASSVVPDKRSEGYKTSETEALAKWKAGDRIDAKAMLYRQSTDAPHDDSNRVADPQMHRQERRRNPMRLQRHPYADAG